MGDKEEERTRLTRPEERSMITRPEERSMITFTPDLQEARQTASSASTTTPGASEPLLTQSADVASKLEPESELSPQPGLLTPRTRPQVVSQGTPEVPPLARSPFLETPPRTSLRATPLFFPEEGSQAPVAKTPPPTTPLLASFPEEPPRDLEPSGAKSRKKPSLPLTLDTPPIMATLPRKATADLSMPSGKSPFVRAHEHFLEPKPLRQAHKEANRRERLIKTTRTLSIHLSFFGTGMYYALFGPTVQDLAVSLDADLFRVLFLLAARGIGGFVGALFGGVFLKPVNPQVLIIIFDLFLAMACIGLSYFDTLFQYVFIFAIGGIALGALNIVGVLWMSAMWRENSGFLLQTLSFMHYMGCVLGPVVGEPFLTHRSVIEAPSATPSYRLTYLSQLEDKDFIYVTYAYWVIGIYLFAVVLLVLAIFFVDPRHENLGMMETRCNPLKLSPIIAVLVAYLAVYVAMEILYSQLIASFALLLGHNKTTAAYLTSLFWATFTTVRGVCILWVQQHGSLTVLLICNGLLVLTACLNSGLGYQTRVMWVGTSLVGACLAPMLPSTLLLLHDHSGVSSARFAGVLFVVGASSAISPLCVGAVMERNPMLFYHGFLGLAFISLLLVVGATVLIHRSEAVIGGYISLPMEERRRSY